MSPPLKNGMLYLTNPSRGCRVDATKENCGSAFWQKYAIVNLWDMIIFFVQPLVRNMCALQESIDRLQELMDKFPENLPNTTLGEEILEKFNQDLNTIHNGIESSGLISASKSIKHVLMRLSDTTFVRLHENLTQIREVIIDDLQDICLTFIPKDKAIFLDKEAKEKENVVKSFPSTLEDYKESVFCYVNGRYTASVFHAMRILEYGLQALANDVGLTFDIQQWYNIINEIESKIKEIAKTLPKGDAKNERLKFLSEAAKEFTYFKDGSRNYVSHNRSKYDEPQALSAFNHVKAFMIHLSTRLAE